MRVILVAAVVVFTLLCCSGTNQCLASAFVSVDCVFSFTSSANLCPVFCFVIFHPLVVCVFFFFCCVCLVFVDRTLNALVDT